MEKLDDDNYLGDIYVEAKEIFMTAAENYLSVTGKEKVSLFKNRSFDKDYLIPVIQSKI
ncbi:hypothetical protein GCM10028895_18920 [Pontibacter rugosus]